MKSKKINKKPLSELLEIQLQSPQNDNEYAESIWEAYQSIAHLIYCLVQLGRKHTDILNLLKAQEPTMSKLTKHTFSRYYQRAINDPAILRRCKAAYSELMAGKKKVDGGRQNTPAVNLAKDAPVATQLLPPVQEQKTTEPASIPITSTPEKATMTAAVVSESGWNRDLWWNISDPLPAGKFRPVPIPEEKRNPKKLFTRPSEDPKNPPDGFWDADKLFEHPLIPGLMLDYIERRFFGGLHYPSPSGGGKTTPELGRHINARRIWDVPGVPTPPDGGVKWHSN